MEDENNFYCAACVDYRCFTFNAEEHGEHSRTRIDPILGKPYGRFCDLAEFVGTFLVCLYTRADCVHYGAFMLSLDVFNNETNPVWRSLRFCTVVSFH